VRRYVALQRFDYAWRRMRSALQEDSSALDATEAPSGIEIDIKPVDLKPSILRNLQHVASF
jgi:hypothetical protein